MRITAVLILISSLCHGQILPGVTAVSLRYNTGAKVYVDIPEPPTFGDTHTLVYATTGSGIQSGDTGGKQQFRVSGNYPFMQFNVVNSDDYSLTSFDNSAPANWSVIGSPSPNDYSLDNINASHGLSLYRLRFEGSDNLIKWNGTDTTLTLKQFYIENCIFRNAGFGGIIINQNVSGDGYGKFTSRFNSFTGSGHERHYLGRTGTSIQYYMDTTTIEHIYADSSWREVVQMNNHKYVKVSNITGRHGGLHPEEGVGQLNGFQGQGIGAGYIKDSYFESASPGMVSTTGMDLINNRIKWTNTDRPIYFQDMENNNYGHFKNVGDDTVRIEGNDFECEGYELTYVLWLQEKNCHYVIRNNRFPPGATSMYRVDGVAPLSITVSGNTFDSDELPPVTFGDHPDPDYAPYWKVITSDYDYNKGRGALTH
jgi:hypothetical protein